MDVGEIKFKKLCFGICFLNRRLKNVFFFSEIPMYINLSITANEVSPNYKASLLPATCSICLHVRLFFLCEIPAILPKISNLSSGSSSVACSLTNFLTLCRSITRKNSDWKTFGALFFALHFAWDRVTHVGHNIFLQMTCIRTHLSAFRCNRQNTDVMTGHGRLRLIWAAWSTAWKSKHENISAVCHAWAQGAGFIRALDCHPEVIEL